MRRAALALLLLAAGCGSDASGSGGERPELVVSAATSLKAPLTAAAGDYDPARVRLGFGGSDELAAQIRQGVKPDVYAAANAKLPAQLREEGLVAEPVLFAGNRLVLALPPAGARRARVARLEDLERPGVRLAIGAASVPVGAYTRTVLERLPARRREAILANVRSEEPDVGGVVGKLAAGAVDAGFVYATDVRAAKLRTVELPATLAPEVSYAAAVVAGTDQPEAARAYVADLAQGRGQEALRAAGFAPPPRTP